MKNLPRQDLMSCAEVNSLDMVDFLESIGHRPKRSSTPSFWYLSPLRDEKTASFKVNRNLNKWFDFGLQRGGSLVDFCMEYYECSLRQVLEKFSGVSTNYIVARPKTASAVKEEPVIKELTTGALLMPALLRYLRSRRIDTSVAQIYCSEAHYKINDKPYYAIAFPNNDGGFELRNKYFKGCHAPKAITHITTSQSRLCVFEGFMDFLSYATITRQQQIPPADYLILNTAGFATSCQHVTAAYEDILLFLDNDKAGNIATGQLMDGARGKARDHRHLYSGYKDLNDWVCHIGLPKGLFHP